MAAMIPADDLNHRLRAEALSAGLRTRQLRPCRGSYADHLHIVLLASGRAELETADGRHELTAPAGLILPPQPDAVLHLSAGSEGWLFGLSPQLLGETLGTDAEMERLLPPGRGLLLSPQLDSAAGPGPESLAAAILSEAASPGTGSRITVLSCLRLLIVTLWRGAQGQFSQPEAAGEGPMIEAFRREVEVHFRNHLPVSGYAERLGVSETRLRRLCLRSLGRTPLQLIHRRLLREAVAWLEHSPKTIAEIAQSLGFADAAEFSHFFKRNTGTSPSHFRSAKRSLAEESADTGRSFADWP